MIAPDPRSERVGVALALASAVMLAIVILVGKLALETLSPSTFTTYFFAFGALWYCIFFAIVGDSAAFRPSRSALLAGTVIAVLDTGYALTFNAALRLLHPAVLGFLGHIADLLAATLGIVILHERFSRKEVLAMILACGGVLVMTARADGILLRGLWLMLASAGFFATNVVAVKRYTRHYPPQHLAFYRAIGITLAMALVSITFLDLRLPAGREWLLLPILGFVGPFLNYACFFHAVKRLDVGTVTIIRMSYSLLVLGCATALYGQRARVAEVVGGLALFAGVAGAVFEKGRLARREVA